MIVRILVSGTGADTWDPPRPDRGLLLQTSIVLVGAVACAASATAALQRLALSQIGLYPRGWVRMTALAAGLGALPMANVLAPAWADPTPLWYPRSMLVIGVCVGVAHWRSLCSVASQSRLLVPVTAAAAGLTPFALTIGRHAEPYGGVATSTWGVLTAFAAYPLASGLTILGLREVRHDQPAGASQQAIQSVWRTLAVLCVLSLVLGIAPESVLARGSWNRYLDHHNLAAPARINGLPPISSIATAGDHALALAADGTVWAWGDNQNAVLGFAGGDGVTTDQYGRRIDLQTKPRSIPGLPGIIDIATSAHHSLAVASDGTLWSWGSNLGNELGETADHPCQGGAPIDWLCRYAPARVTGVSSAVQVAAANRVSAALRQDGSVLVWGNVVTDAAGLVTGTDPANVFSSIPTALPGIADAVQIAADDSFVVIRRGDGRVATWDARSGRSASDLAGVTTATWVGVRFGAIIAMTTDESGWRPDAAAVQRIGPMRMAILGYGRTYVVTESGTVFTWGDARGGLLGSEPHDTCYAMGSSSDTAWWDVWPCRNQPGRVPGLPAIALIAVGNAQAYALGNDGSVWSWGARLAG